MSITRNIGNGDVKITIDDNRSENEKKNNPIKVAIGDVEIIIRNAKEEQMHIYNKNEKRFFHKNDGQLSKQKKIKHVPSLDIDETLPTLREDDFVLVRKMFLKKFNCEFCWKEDDIYEFIGEHLQMYDKNAIRKFYRLTMYPLSHVRFWRAFYNSKN